MDPENADGNPPSGTCPGYVYTYDSNGNELSEVTPQGRETDYVYYSGTNRLYTKTLKDKDRNGNSVNRVTTYTYYGSTKGDQVDTMTDACGNVTTYDYSTSTGYRISETPQVGNATTYGYNDMGDVDLRHGRQQQHHLLSVRQHPSPDPGDLPGCGQWAEVRDHDLELLWQDSGDG